MEKENPAIALLREQNELLNKQNEILSLCQRNLDQIGCIVFILLLFAIVPFIFGTLIFM